MPSRSPAPTSWAAYAKALGIELQRQRIAVGPTQEDLAHRAGLTRTHYQQIEKGEWKPGLPANPSVKVLARLAQALKLQIGDVTPAVNHLEPDT